METAEIIECPRDAWQGLPKVIPTDAKVTYLRRLVELGFRHIDAVSFVSPKLVPQMADSELVMRELTAARETGHRKHENGNSKLEIRQSGSSFDFRVSSLDVEIIAIVVNVRGLERALATPGVTTIGYPHSISEQFARQNANTSVAESRALVEKIRPTVVAAGRNLVVYISMAFGNPYGDPWSVELVIETVEWLKRTGVKIVSFADTVGKARNEDVTKLLRAVSKCADGVEIGVHLHSRPEAAAEKVLAAYEAGCRRFDSALTGLGGCPFAGDELVGNIPTEIVVSTLAARGIATGIEPWAMLSALEATKEIRRDYAHGG